MKSISHYCPILDRIVKIKGEREEDNKKFSKHTAICQEEKSKCSGNCEGCSLM